PQSPHFVSVFPFPPLPTTDIYTLSLHDALPIFTCCYSRSKNGYRQSERKWWSYCFGTPNWCNRSGVNDKVTSWNGKKTGEVWSCNALYWRWTRYLHNC